MDHLRKKIRSFLRESFNQETLDLILDKIAQYGMSSLNSHEKQLLDDMSKNKNVNSDNDLILHFLNFHYSPLRGESFVINKMGKRSSGINYTDKKGMVLFELEVESEVLGVFKKPNFLYINKSLEIVLHQNFTISPEDAKWILTEWFTKETNIKPNSVDYFYVNEP